MLDSGVECKYVNRWKDDNRKSLNLTIDSIVLKEFLSFNMNECDMKTHFVADKLVRLKVGQELVVELLLCRLPVQVFWVILRDRS